MASQKMINAINHQINRELYSAYLYLGMASFAGSTGKRGVDSWFRAQAKEEIEHADKMYDYVIDSGFRVNIEAIEEPPQDFSSIEDLFAKTLAHEKNVTGMINDLVAMAKEDGDAKTEEFLQWYVKEQKEEEATPAGILGKLKGKDDAGIMEVDAQLGRRGKK